MLGRYKDRFGALSLEEAALVWRRVSARHPDIPHSAVMGLYNGAGLHQTFTAANLCHAEVVMSIARDTGPVAEHAIEVLVGRPITRVARGTVATVSQRRQPRAARSDPRTIHVAVAECPKKPGTTAWALWQLYRDGMSVDEFMAAGGTRAAVRYDSEHGYIKLGEGD